LQVHCESVSEISVWLKLGMAFARPEGMFRKSLLVLLLATSAGCRRNPEESAMSQPAPPPAALLAAQGKSLNASLQDLQQELSAALGTGLDDEGGKHILRAEAISDRLLESQLPFSWLASTSYSLEAYVRQIQALADRIVAEMRSGSDHALVMQDAQDLRKKVVVLRRALAMGGARAPESLDSLLANIPRDSAIIAGAGE
jgi:hypothetical protein